MWTNHCKFYLLLIFNEFTVQTLITLCKMLYWLLGVSSQREDPGSCPFCVEFVCSLNAGGFGGWIDILHFFQCLLKMQK